jgi:hypothetical protein
MLGLDIEIPCPRNRNHYCPGLNDTFHRPTLPGHHPLTKEETARLLAFLVDKDIHTQQVDAIYRRLIQGIVGMVCPTPLSGGIGEKASELKHLFSNVLHSAHALHNVDTANAPAVVERLYQIMTG